MVVYLVTKHRGRCFLCSDWSSEFLICNSCLVNWKGNEPPILIFTVDFVFWKAG